MIRSKIPRIKPVVDNRTDMEKLQDSMKYIDEIDNRNRKWWCEMQEKTWEYIRDCINDCKVD